MRWNAKSIRRAAGFLPDGEALLCPVLASGVPQPATSGLSGSSLSGTGFILRMAAAGSNRSGASPDPPAKENLSPQTALSAQHSSQDGVPVDMATLVLDNSSLGVGPVTQPEVRQGLTAKLDPAGLDPSSDAAIMLRAAVGDEAAFNYLAEKYHRPIIHFLFRMVRNQAIAEELAQEVFLRVYRSRNSYEPSAKFTTWLYRIATNLAVNHARDTRHERPENTVRLDEPDQETGTTPDLADESISAEEQILKQERLAAIRGKVNALPERQRVAVIMHKYQQMDYREIAGVLKLSESATKSLLFRAYETLREQLKEFVSGK
jgi:RNA polymerase sigma-70 factor (ECF subfamily)